MKDKDQAIRDAYREATGREPRKLSQTDPLAWQWDYRGTPEERAKLEEEVLDLRVHPAQESLL